MCVLCAASAHGGDDETPRPQFAALRRAIGGLIIHLSSPICNTHPAIAVQSPVIVHGSTKVIADLK